MLLEAVNAARPHLFGQTVDDLDAGQIALVHGAVEGLPGKGFLVHGAVGIAVEVAAELVFELADALDGHVDQGPGKLLVRQPFTALDRVHEMALDRVLGGERNVVAALHHARAAAFAEKALHRDSDRKVRVALVCVQRGKQPRPA